MDLSAVRLAKWRCIKWTRHSVKLWDSYKYDIAAILVSLTWKLYNTGFFDALLDVGLKSLFYSGLYSNTATSECFPASSNIHLNQITNFYFNGLSTSQDNSYLYDEIPF